MDLLELNFRVHAFIDEQDIDIQQLKVSLDKINTLLQGPFNLRNRMISKLKNFKDTLIVKIDNHENLKYFKVDVDPLIERYHKLNNQTMVIPFFNTNKKFFKEHVDKKEQIQREYMQKLKQYHNLKHFTFSVSTSCAFVPKSSPPPCACGNKTEFIKDEDRVVCALCSTEQCLISNTSSFSDVGRVNMASKYTYNRKVHFRDCIIQYQGKQKTHIPEEIYTILEVKLIERKIISPHCANERSKKYEKVTRAILLDILKELESKDIKKFYDDIVLIHHTLTGQPCDNIEYLEDALLDDFDKLTETYDNLYIDRHNDEKDTKPTKRKNFINAQFVLYQLLRKHGHPCNEMDFLTLKTSERKRFHHTICKELFSILGWKYSYSI